MGVKLARFQAFNHKALEAGFEPASSKATPAVYKI